MAEELFEKLLSNHDLRFEDFLRNLLRDRLLFLKQNREIFQIIVKEFFYNEEIRHELIPYFAENIGSRLVQVIRTFQERGELSDQPAETMARHIFFSIGGTFIFKFVFGLNGSQDEEADIESVVRFVMDGVRNR